MKKADYYLMEMVVKIKLKKGYRRGEMILKAVYIEKLIE
jgi:hypothetical protein